MSRYGLCGKLTAAPGQRDALLAELLQAGDLLEDAPGCEIWIVSTIPDEPDNIWVTEFWRDKADHDASLTGEGVKAIIARAMPLIAGMPEQIILSPVGGKGLPEASQ